MSGGNCPLSYCSDITVRVEVTDINDHAPQFVFDASMSRYVAEISENSPASLILQLVATDEDSTSNGQIMFLPSTGKLHIISGGPRNFFQRGSRVMKLKPSKREYQLLKVGNWY